MTKIATYRVNPRELVQLGDSLNNVSEIKKLLESSKSKELKSFGKRISKGNNLSRQNDSSFYPAWSPIIWI